MNSDMYDHTLKGDRAWFRFTVGTNQLAFWYAETVQNVGVLWARSVVVTGSSE
jgi:hypothetical protein